MCILVLSSSFRFGFIPDKCPISRITNVTFTGSATPNYVHYSGGMFAMIPDTKTSSPRNRDGTHRKVTVGSFKEYIAYQSSRTDGMPHTGSNTTETDSVTSSAYYQVGFLWSWNYMLTKRWRSSNTGDEHFQDKVLADFRSFCSNDENRLKDYWSNCWAKQRDFMEQADVVHLPEEAMSFQEDTEEEEMLISENVESEQMLRSDR